MPQTNRNIYHLFVKKTIYGNPTRATGTSIHISIF